jgi:UDP-glucose:(heptosyl)LPS alpha-1,3-glucosyltransferase
LIAREGVAAMNKRIAVVGRYFNQQGGVSNVMAQLAIRATKNYDVEAISNEYLDFPDTLHASPAGMVRHPKWLQIPSFAMSSQRVIAKTPFDLVHAHDPQTFNADLYTAHSCFKQYIGTRRESSSLLKRAASALYPPHLAGLAMSDRAYARTRAHIVTVSGSVRDEILSQYDITPDRVSVIYNGVDVEKFSSPDRAVSRRLLSGELQLDLQDKVIFVFVGYEFGRKRLDTAIRAFAAADPQGRSHLLVAGGANSAEYVRLASDLRVSDRVTFLGHRSDVASILRASDVFLFPTQYEAASLAVLEAAAAGLAMVTTDVAMAKEVFTDGEDALLLPNVSDAEPMTRAIRYLLENEHRLEKLKRSAQKRAEDFTWDHAWTQYELLYAELIAKKTRNAR